MDPNEGERVVRGRGLIQAASDIFLGWQSFGDSTRSGAVARFAEFYADQNDLDFAAFQGAVATGTLTAAGIS